VAALRRASPENGKKEKKQHNFLGRKEGRKVGGSEQNRNNIKPGGERRVRSLLSNYHNSTPDKRCCTERGKGGGGKKRMTVREGEKKKGKRKGRGF